MQPAQYDFRIRPGDTEPLGVVLETIDLLTEDRYGLDYAHAVAAWTITRAGVAVTRTTAPAGGLVPDPRTKALLWTLSPAESQAFADGKPATYSIVVTADDGTVQTFLVGRIIPEILA